MLVALLALVWLASGFYIVDESQRGLVLQFGRYKESTPPGLRWRLPIRSSRMSSGTFPACVRSRSVIVAARKTRCSKEALMLTDDENIINIQFAVQYVLKDPVDYIFNNRHPDDAVMQAAETAIREIVGKSKMDFVLYEGREQVAAIASKSIRDILDRYKTGIMISR